MLMRILFAVGIVAVLASLAVSAPLTAHAQESVTGSSSSRAQTKTGDASALEILRDFQEKRNTIHAKTQDFKNHAKIAISNCASAGQRLHWTGTAWNCSNETDPRTKLFAKNNLPTCAGNQVLTATSASVLTCTTPAVGAQGARPDHSWSGTSLRFQRANGSWGSFVDLKGPPGVDVACP